MDASKPRAGGPSRRRSFTPAERVDHLSAYEAACAEGGGGAYLRRQGLYSSQITEWRKLRDAGVLAGKQAGAGLGRPSKDQAELARLRRQLALAEQRLSRTAAALEIMGKHTRSWRFSPRARRRPSPGSAEAPKPGEH